MQPNRRGKARPLRPPVPTPSLLSPPLSLPSVPSRRQRHHPRHQPVRGHARDRPAGALPPLRLHLQDLPGEGQGHGAVQGGGRRDFGGGDTPPSSSPLPPSSSLTPSLAFLPPRPGFCLHQLPPPGGRGPCHRRGLRFWLRPPDPQRGMGQVSTGGSWAAPRGAGGGTQGCWGLASGCSRPHHVFFIYFPPQTLHQLKPLPPLRAAGTSK